MNPSPKETTSCFLTRGKSVLSSCDVNGRSSSIQHGCLLTVDSYMRSGFNRNREADDADNLETDLDALVAKDMAGLTIEERRKIAEEVDGATSSSVDDDEAVVQRCLEALDRALAGIRGKLRNAFDLAMATNPNYVKSRSFRMMFLRADRFNAEKAAIRIAHHFQYKLELFGKEKLAKPITYEDLSNDDRDSLYCGSTQFLGTKDSKGRTLMFVFPKLLKCATMKNQMRARWYQYMVALDDESAQRNGMVAVLFGLQLTTHMSDQVLTLRRTLPYRFVACHICVANNKLNSMARAVLSVCGRDACARYVIHTEDSPIRFLYSLQLHGIDSASVPVGDDGEPQINTLVAVIQIRRHQEERCKNLAALKKVTDRKPLAVKNEIKPKEIDVLLGQGKARRAHQGNIIMERYIEEALTSYEQASSQFLKTCVVAGVIQRIQDADGRFLRFDKRSKTYVLAGDSRAHDSVSGRFRVKLRQRQRGGNASDSTVARLSDQGSVDDNIEQSKQIVSKDRQQELTNQPKKREFDILQSVKPHPGDQLLRRQQELKTQQKFGKHERQHQEHEILRSLEVHRIRQLEQLQVQAQLEIEGQKMFHEQRLRSLLLLETEQRARQQQQLLARQVEFQLLQNRVQQFLSPLTRSTSISNESNNNVEGQARKSFKDW